MATKTDCLPPVTIGGITITAELLENLDTVKDYGLEGLHFFAQETIILAGVDLEHYGLEQKLFPLLHDFFMLMRSLVDVKEGGRNES